EFFGLTRITQRQYNVAIVDDADVAVQRIDAVQHHARRPGAGERGGDLPADVAAFADADHDELSTPFQSLDNESDGTIEGVVELAANSAQGGQFDIENFTSACQVAHRREPASVRRDWQ